MISGQNYRVKRSGVYNTETITQHDIVCQTAQRAIKKTNNYMNINKACKLMSHRNWFQWFYSIRCIAVSLGNHVAME